MATRMQQRRGTAAQWLSTNNGNGPVLNVGEIGYETDTNKFKIGDGTNHWIDLNYFADSVALGGSIDDYIPLTQKGAANGVATLNSDGVIPSSQIPSLVGLDTEITTAVNNAVTNLVGVAPSALDTLAELAGALNNDEDFSSTVANELSLKASTEYVDNEIDTLTSTLTSDISTAVTTHNQDTAGVHGIADTSVLVTLNGTETLVNKTLQSPTVTTGSAGETVAPAYSGSQGSATPSLMIDYGYSGNYSGWNPGSASSVPAGWPNIPGNMSYYIGKTLVISGSPVSHQNGEWPIVEAGTSGFGSPIYFGLGGGFIGTNQGGGEGYATVSVKTANTLKTISDTEIAYLDGVTSNIQTQLDAKVSTSNLTELAQDAVGNAVGTGLSYNDSTGAISVDETIIDSNISAALVAPTISTSLTLDGSGDFTIAADANIVLDATTEVYIGSASSGNEVAIKSYVDAAVGNVDLSTKQDVVSGVSNTEIGYLDGVTSSIQTQIDAKAPSTNPTFIVGGAGESLSQANYTNNGLLFGRYDAFGYNADGTKSYFVYVNGIGGFGTEGTNVVDLTGITPGYILTISHQTDPDNINGSYTVLDNINLPDWNGTNGGRTLIINNGPTSLVGLQDNGYTWTLAPEQTTISSEEISYLDGVTSAIQTQLNAKAPIASPTFTGTATTDDLVVNGDFTVNGTNFAASATSITIEDNIVQLAHQNAANTVDLGLVVAYNDGSTKHAGIVRDVSDAKWKLFKGVSTEPSTVVAFGEGSLDDLAVAVLEATSISATSATIGDVSNTELQYLNGVTSAIQTQLDAKQAIVSGVSNTEIGYLDGVTSAIQTQIDSKAPIANPTFTGTVAGVTKAHVGLGNVDNTSDANKPVSTATQTALDAKSDKIIVINPQTSNYTLTLSDVDDLVEMNVGSANTLTVPANSDVALPVGTRVHIVQTGSGQTTITPGSGVTVNGTPGLKTRAQWSAVTLVKRATNTWVAFGDLTA